MACLNQLEPDSLIRHFLAHPPRDFIAWTGESGMPFFSTRFDLLTTLDADARKKLERLPLFSLLHGLLKKHTCFSGTTVSEYGLLPKADSAAELAANLVSDYGKSYPLFIVKDLPIDSPLLDEESNRFSEAMLAELKEQGCIIVEGQALAWVPVDYADVSDYLGRLSSGRRKDLKRKLKVRPELDIEVCDCGDARFDDPEVLDLFYALYLNVFQQSEVHFDLLTKAFFTAVLQDASTPGKVFLYKHAGRLIGYNICFIEGDALIDKYVGFEYPAARQFNLYHLSWFYNLEYAAEQGLKKYIAGWTDPEIKAYLGAQFTLTRHAVYVRNPLLRRVLRSLSPLFESDSQWAQGYRKKE